MRIRIAGTDLDLLPERAVYLEDLRTLVVADLHWGKAATLRAAAIPVPPGTTTSDLGRLSRALQRTGAEHLVVMGDLVHAPAWKAPRTQQAIAQWRAAHTGLAITLVRGNHDVRAGAIPEALAITACAEPLRLAGLELRHFPAQPGSGYALAGHLHPSITLAGRGRQRERLPCFHFGRHCGILPAFGSFTGMAPVSPVPGDRVFVVAGDEIVEVDSPDA